MISQSQYKAHPERWWIGKRVRARHDLQNGWFIAPAGSVFVITKKRNGFGLSLAEPCKCCGLRGSISEVEPQLLELLDNKGSLL
ncbi:hypothetical protein MASR1M32_10210 [Rhodobacter sp.]